MHPEISPRHRPLIFPGSRLSSETASAQISSASQSHTGGAFTDTVAHWKEAHQDTRRVSSESMASGIPASTGSARPI